MHQNRTIIYYLNSLKNISYPDMGNSVFLLEKSPYDDGWRGPPLLRFPPSSERNFCQETQRGHQEGPSQGQKTGDECHECELGGPLPDLEGRHALGLFQQGLSPENKMVCVLIDSILLLFFYIFLPGGHVLPEEPVDDAALEQSLDDAVDVRHDGRVPRQGQPGGAEVDVVLAHHPHADLPVKI